MLLLWLFSLVGTSTALTCYNGMRLLRMQSVGQSVEECPPSAYCYNMTASAALVVDMVKAGCSTWRCMLARDTCISTTFQLIPVSLCCCSTDRCNVGENPAYDSLSSGGGGSGGWGGGGSSGGSGGWGGGGGSSGGSGGWGGGGGSSDGATTTRAPSGRWSPKQIEEKFRDYDVDHRGDGDAGEEVFEKVDIRHTTQSPGGGSGRRFSLMNDRKGSQGGGGTAAGSSGGEGKEIELDD